MTEGTGEAGTFVSGRAGKTELIMLFLLAGSAIFLLFYGLGTRYLWQDEAQTPLIAKTILQRFFPYGTDGLNFFSQTGGLEYGKNYLWKWHPWLPFYVSALAIKIFGSGNFALRFPFAFFGLGSVFAVYFMMRRLTGSRQKAFFSAAAVVLSTAFLLLSRQCRYYSMEMFFSITAIFSYLEYQNTRKTAPLVLLFVFLTCLFHTLYLNFFLLIGAMCVHWLLSGSKKDKNIPAVFAMALCFNIPFIFSIYNINFSYVGQNAFNWRLVMHSMVIYVSYTLKYLCPYFILLFSAGFYLMGAVQKKRLYFPQGPEGLLALFPAVLLVFIPVLTPAAFLRNIACLVIPLSILSGLVCRKVFAVNRLAGAALLVAVAMNSPLLSYVHEITGDWKEADECTAEYINANSKKGDTIVIIYPDMPLKLYTGLKVYGGLTGESLSGMKKPDFIIFRKDIGSEYERLTRKYIYDNFKAADYKPQQLPCAERFWENREDILFHDFGPDDKLPRVVVYRLIKKTGAP